MDKFDEYMKDAATNLAITPEIPPTLRLVGVSINDITIKRKDFDEFFTQTVPNA